MSERGSHSNPVRDQKRLEEMLGASVRIQVNKALDALEAVIKLANDFPIINIRDELAPIRELLDRVELPTQPNPNGSPSQASGSVRLIPIEASNDQLQARARC